MTDDAPSEFADLERRLAQREQTEAPVELRRRVIEAMRSELASPRPRVLQPRPWWEFAAAAAAVAVALSNLSVSAVQATDYGLRQQGETQPVDVAAEQIVQLLPELTQRQALRYAIVRQGGSRLVPAPWPRPQAAALGRVNTRETDDELRTALD